LAAPIGSMIAGSSILPYPKTLPLTFILTAFSGVVMMIVAIKMREPKRHKASEDPVRLGIEGFKQIFRHKKLRAFALNSSLISASVFFMFWFYQPLAGRVGIDIKYYGLIAAAYNVFSMVLLLNIKRIEKIFGIKSILLYSAVIPGLLLIGVGLIRNTLFLVVGVLLIVGLRLMRTPILHDFMNRVIKSKERATVLSGVGMIERMTMFVMYPIVGLLADVSLTAVLVFLGVMTLVFAVVTRIEAGHLD
jgi:MFS family permease